MFILRIVMFQIFWIPHFHILWFQISMFPDFQVPRFSDFQAPRFPDAAGATAIQALRSKSDPSPDDPRDQLRRKEPLLRHRMALLRHRDQPTDQVCQVSPVSPVFALPVQSASLGCSKQARRHAEYLLGVTPPRFSTVSKFVFGL